MIVLTDEQCSALYAYLSKATNFREQNRRLDRDSLIISLMLDAGLRVGEVHSLCICDLYQTSEPVQTVYVRPEIAKTGKGRYIPITTRIRDSITLCWLDIWQPAMMSGTDPAFMDMRCSRALTIRQMQRIVCDAGNKIGIQDLHPHTLRHTFATRLMRVCSMRVVQQLLGHASLSSTEIYTHPNFSDLRSAIDKIDSTSGVTPGGGMICGRILR